MDRTSFADEAVAALVNDRYVPVRVDADRRPDLSERYGLGGWPTTAFLTPDGDMLGGGTYVDASRLEDVLQRVHAAFVSGRHVRARPRPAAHAPSPALSPEQLVAQVMDAFDPVHGGVGDAPKFPHAAPIELALDLHRTTGQAKFRDMAAAALDAMGWGPLYDPRAGGFFRCARNADWTEPHEEKLLEVNASLLSLYLDAYEALGVDRYRERAENVLAFVGTSFADEPTGGWAASQRPSPPFVDRTLFCDWNAVMASAALHAGRLLSDPDISAFAIRSLERVALLLYKPGAGVAHYADPDALDGTRAAGLTDVRGLLDDQITLASAMLDAFEATGNETYEMLARELALYAIRTMWDGDQGGFFDRAEDVRRDIGLLRRRIKPFAANCRAARVLARAARTADAIELSEYAARTLAAMSARAPAEGALAAEYLLALGEAAPR